MAIIQFFTSVIIGLFWFLSSGSMVKSRVNSFTLDQNKIAPRVFIVSMYEPEGEVWWGIPEFDLLAHNITVPGISPRFPDVHCTADNKVCQVTTGEGEINAAATISSISFSPLFDLSQTYFLIAGIAGVNPKVATTCSVTFARFAVQVALQYEIDIRELPANISTGYIPLGAYAPGQYPSSIYGTEVFEVNAALRSMAASFAQTAELADSDTAKKYRSLYATDEGTYEAATKPPGVVECDTATADTWWSGHLLSETADNTTNVLTNGQGQYCTTQEEDNATLEALLRSSVQGLTDFARIIILRTGSDFDEPHPGQSAIDNLVYADQGAVEPAIQNLYLAGVKVVEGILDGWDSKFAEGIAPQNYIGDIWGTLGGTPDFGPRENVTKRSYRSRGRRF